MICTTPSSKLDYSGEQYHLFSIGESTRGYKPMPIYTQNPYGVAIARIHPSMFAHAHRLPPDLNHAALFHKHEGQKVSHFVVMPKRMRDYSRQIPPHHPMYATRMSQAYHSLPVPHYSLASLWLHQVL